MTDFATKSARIAELRAMGAAVSYEICINEEQRAALLQLVQNAPELTREGGPLEYWSEMLANLPKEEAETPGTLHGFCI